MNDENANVLDNEFPWVTFRLNAQNYCISSENVIQMVIKNELTPVPQSPSYYLGISCVRGENFPVVDLRNLFGVTPLQESIDAFVSMKDKHLSWVEALERHIYNNESFTLPRDPHKCSFGLWYDNFQTENISIKHILNKINKPHREMHMQADIVDDCRRRGDEECALKTLERAKDICENAIVPLLDQLIEAYINATKGMIILLKKDEAKLGVLVDNITAIEEFIGASNNSNALNANSSIYIKSIIYAKDHKAYFDVDESELFNLLNTI